MKLKQQFSRLLKIVVTYRIILVWLLILILLGFTLWQTLKISDPQVDEQYLQRQRAESQKEATGLELDTDLEAKINKLESTPVDTTPSNLGTRDPFNPQ